MANKNLTPWNDRCMFVNTVYDSNTHESRGITEVEKEIVEYCDSRSHAINDACSELRYNKFERERFRTDDLLSAAEAIYEYESSKSGYKSKRALYLLKELPEYISSAKK